MVADARKKLIDQEWRDFEEATVVETAGKEQREDLRDAFFAGAMVFMKVLAENSETREQIGEALDFMKKELLEFAEVVANRPEYESAPEEVQQAAERVRTGAEQALKDMVNEITGKM